MTTQNIIDCWESGIEPYTWINNTEPPDCWTIHGEPQEIDGKYSTEAIEQPF